MKDMVAKSMEAQKEIESLKQAKADLLKVKGKPQKIIDKLNSQIEMDIDEITRLRTELAKSKGVSAASIWT